MSESALIAPKTALSIAQRTSGDIAPPYAAVAAESHSDCIELRLVRYVGTLDGHMLERVQKARVSRAHAISDFAHLCRSKWLFLRREHERMEKSEAV